MMWQIFHFRRKKKWCQFPTGISFERGREMAIYKDFLLSNFLFCFSAGHLWTMGGNAILPSGKTAQAFKEHLQGDVHLMDSYLAGMLLLQIWAIMRKAVKLNFHIYKTAFYLRGTTSLLFLQSIFYALY